MSVFHRRAAERRLGRLRIAALASFVLAALTAGGAVSAQPMSAWHLAKIRAPQAWGLTQGSADVVIAVVDSGVDPYHRDLAGKLVAGINTNDKPAHTQDQFGHGTKVAGVVAARSSDGTGITGVAGLSTLMPVRVTDRAGRAATANIAKGIVWAVDHGARVVNVSLDGVAGIAAVRAAAEYAFRHGVLVVAPSGNCACTDPAAETPYILSVSATDEADHVAALSTAGAFVDLAAPGVNISTTAMYGLNVTDSGTSLASGVVAGVAALMFAANPALTPAVVTQLLQATAVQPGGGGRDPRIGHGRVDAFAAVSAAASFRGAGFSAGVKDSGAASANTATVAGKAP